MPTSSLCSSVNRETQAWSQLCQRQSDVVLHVGYADSLRTIAEYETDPDVSGVRWHTRSSWSSFTMTSQPTDTAEILAVRSPRRYHHIRHGSTTDVERVARIVGGESVGVVFGGGGARGFAHLGVLQGDDRGRTCRSTMLVAPVLDRPLPQGAPWDMSGTAWSSYSVV